MEIRLTPRNFEIIEFPESHGLPCNLQQSSSIDNTQRGLDNPGSSFIWFGLKDSRMHLSRENLIELLPHLQQWLKTGNFSKEEK